MKRYKFIDYRWLKKLVDELDESDDLHDACLTICIRVGSMAYPIETLQTVLAAINKKFWPEDVA